MADHGLAKTPDSLEPAGAARPPPRLPIPVDDVWRLLGMGGALGERQRAVWADLTRGRTVIGLADLFRLLRKLAFAAGEETFALSARPMIKGTAELVLSRAAGAKTVEEGLRKIAEAYNLMHGADYNRVKRGGGQLTFSMHDDAFPYTRPRDDLLHFSLECALIFVHAAVCELAASDLSARVVRVSTRRAANTGFGAVAGEFWTAPVIYGAPAYGLTYEASVGDLPARGPQPGLAPDLAVHNRILSLIEHPAAAPNARGLSDVVRQALTAGAADQEAVASALAMSVATLRRRLAEEGVTFRGLHQDVRNAYARARILEARDIGAVAEEMGFSDPRAFTRAFKAWNGLTPSDYRARQGRADVSEIVP
jgi:AraC-like DNA-binding protein